MDVEETLRLNNIMIDFQTVLLFLELNVYENSRRIYFDWSFDVAEVLDEIRA